MSTYINSKPRWCKTVAATEQGWVNSLNGELLVSHRGLKSKIDAELASQPKEEVIMQVQEEVKVELAPVQVEVKEETIKKPKKKQKLLGEVVEFNIPKDSEVIGE